MSQVVDPKLAEACIEQYTLMYTSDDYAAIQKAFSTSVSFPFSSINQFMVSAAATTDTLEICFGVYTAAFAQQYGVEEGRLTVFLCTKRGGGGVGSPPNDFLNIGQTQP